MRIRSFKVENLDDRPGQRPAPVISQRWRCWLPTRPLLRGFLGAEVHNEALPDESGALRRDTHFPESDHAPVVAAFETVTAI